MTSPAAPQEPPSRWRGWVEAVLVYREPKVLAMLFLGFSAGLPFYLVFQTLSAWLRQDGIQRAAIGMLAWAGLMYSLKFIWSPIVDRMSLPLLKGWLGQRRSWMLLAQGAIIIALLNLSAADPSANLKHVALGALFLAFCAATQDIAVDAWRIESASVERQGAMAAAYQLGYSIALICGSAGALEVAHRFGWNSAYTTMAALGFVGIVTTLIIREPERTMQKESLAQEERVVEWLERKAHWPHALRNAGATFIGAVICPLTDFMSRYGATLGVAILLFIGCYRLTEFAQGSMTNSFYIDSHYTLEQIATVVKLYGLPMRILGVFIGGALIVRFGLKRTLVIGSVLIACSNLGFALLARVLAATGEPTLWGLGLVNGFDFIAYGIHGTVLIAFLSSLTSTRYTATQYALFSTLYALPGKALEGFSGFIVDAIGYSRFFVYTAALSIPGLLLLWWLARRGHDRLFK